MKNIDFKPLIPHLLAIAIFFSVSLIYFYPVLQGKTLKQGDIIQFRGMAKEIVDFREATGEEALWTNSMFGGMPAFQISVMYYNNFARYLDKIISLNLPIPVKYLFLSLIGFYILLLAFRVDPWLAVAGALAFGFSTYFFIIEAAGHNTKAHAMTFMAPLIAGIVLSFRGKVMLGASLTGLFLSLQLYTNHLQITYYTLIVVVLFGLYELVSSIREKKVLEFLRIIGILLLPVILAVSMNITNLWLTWEYSHYSTRGKSELTHKQDIQTTGLDKSYILDDYSYGIMETMNLLIPDFKGRSSSYSRGRSSEVFRVLQQNGIPNALALSENMPTYWGPQRYTAGPVYIGATVIFLFIFGLFLVKGRMKWWLLSATLLSVLLAWGKHLPWLSEFFIDYIPGYNKFRTVSMILVIAELTIPFLGILAISEMLKEKYSRADVLRALKYSIYSLGGLVLLFAVIPGAFVSFSGGFDNDMLAAGYPDFLINALQDDRQAMLRADALRSLIFIVLTGGIVLLFYYGKIRRVVFIAALGLLILTDLWVVSRRFLDSSNYVSKRESQAFFQPSQIDLQILEDEDPNYRVLNLTRSPFNDAVTSYHHKSIGGYHGAKMGRYQDVIEKYLGRFNLTILNMLNTKYLIVPSEDSGLPILQRNPEAMGNAWFVNSVRIVENADEEIAALGEFDPQLEMIVDKRFRDLLIEVPEVTDSLAVISLLSYQPNQLIYESVSETPQLAVFSEIYYSKGWEVYISGEPAPHFRTNYILRGMSIPEGSHTIEFKFKPRAYYNGEKVALAGSLLMVLLLVGMFYLEVKEYLKKVSDEV